ncbi:MAG: isobutyryl-CoA mutase small subunit, partial [Actinomycetota bacterium]|nr:isobutyryl-CoA mutase small subunit [Actinomycetota bacterium]
LIPRGVDMLREAGLGDVIVFAGGIIPDPDRTPLSEMGVAQVFTPGASLQEVTQWLELALDERESRASAAPGGR